MGRVIKCSQAHKGLEYRIFPVNMARAGLLSVARLTEGYVPVHMVRMGRVTMCSHSHKGLCIYIGYYTPCTAVYMASTGRVIKQV